MKSITIVANNMLPGGAERVISILANFMVEQGVRVNVILVNKTDIYYNFNSKVNIISIEKLSGNAQINKLLKYKKIRQIIKKDKPDIVLSMPEEIGIYVLLAMVWTGIPVVVSERNNPRVMPYKKATRFLRKIAYNFAAGIVFQTHNAAEFFSNRIQKKGIILKNPLNAENIPQAFEGTREKKIVGTGRLFEQKNFKLLISAFSEFQKIHSDYSLIIYGEGHLRKELEEYAENMLLKGSWKMPGRSTNWLEESKEAAMFVLSSDFEGMPNALIEAMATGIPSISTYCPSDGSSELIENNQNGILIPVGDADSLCKAMCKIADDEEFSKVLSKNALRIKENLNSETICRQWLDYLEGIIKYNGYRK